MYMYVCVCICIYMYRPGPNAGARHLSVASLYNGALAAMCADEFAQIAGSLRPHTRSSLRPHTLAA